MNPRRRIRRAFVPSALRASASQPATATIRATRAPRSQSIIERERAGATPPTRRRLHTVACGLLLCVSLRCVRVRHTCAQSTERTSGNDDEASKPPSCPPKRHARIYFHPSAKLITRGPKANTKAPLPHRSRGVVLVATQATNGPTVGCGRGSAFARMLPINRLAHERVKRHAAGHT